MIMDFLFLAFGKIFILNLGKFVRKIKLYIQIELESQTFYSCNCLWIKAPLNTIFFSSSYEQYFLGRVNKFR